ncbi:hypothetical protein D3C75_786270 [compost metagenome]
MLEQAQVVRQCLGKTEARIKDDSVCVDARRSAGGHSLLKVTRNVGGHIFVMWVVLHVTRLAAHVHEAYRQAGICGSIQGAIALQGSHVVDQPGTEARRFTHDRWGGGIDRDDHVEAAVDRLDHGGYPLQLLGHRNRARARPRGLAADVDQRGACGNHRFGMTQRLVALVEAPAIGEGIRGDIENTHDMGTGQIKNPVAARQPGWVLL